MGNIVKILFRICFLPIVGLIWLVKTFIVEFINAVKEGLEIK